MAHLSGQRPSYHQPAPYVLAAKVLLSLLVTGALVIYFTVRSRRARAEAAAMCRLEEARGSPRCAAAPSAGQGHCAQTFSPRRLFDIRQLPLEAANRYADEDIDDGASDDAGFHYMDEGAAEGAERAGPGAPRGLL